MSARSFLLGVLSVAWLSLPAARAATPAEETADRHLRAGQSALAAYDKSGEIKFKEDQLNLAAVEFNQAVAAAENYARAYRARGRFSQQYKEDLPAARRDFERAVSLQPDDPTNHLSLVLGHFAAADWPAALSVCDELLRRFDIAEPDDMRKFVLFHVREWRGMSLLALGRDAEANEEFARAAKLGDRLREEISGPNVAAYPQLGTLVWIDERVRMPDRLWEFRLRNLAMNEVEWCAQACVFVLHRIDDKVLTFKENRWLWAKMESLEPKTAEGWYGRAEVRRHKMELDAHYGGIRKAEIPLAIADYDQAEKQGLTTPTMLFRRAQLLLDVGNEERALADFEACFRSQTKAFDVIFGYAGLERAIALAEKRGSSEQRILFLSYYLDHCDELLTPRRCR